MTPNLSEMFSFANLKDNAAVKSALDTQTQIARLFSDHARARISAAGELSRTLFEAGAKLTAIAADPARFEEISKDVTAGLTETLKAHAEATIASNRALQGEMTALVAGAFPTAA